MLLLLLLLLPAPALASPCRALTLEAADAGPW
jgi:hypothetical protein